MTQLLFPLFYRQFGVRRIQSLMEPNPQTITTLPRSSMVHYLSNDKDILDVDPSKLYYHTGSRRVVIDFIDTLSSHGNLGMPRLQPTNLRAKYSPFLKKNRNFRHVRQGYLQQDEPLTLFVNNYSYLHELYRYVNLPMSVYNEWYNSTRTVFDTIVKIGEFSKKNHFVFIDVPKESPSFGLLNMYIDNNNPTMLKIFDTPSKLMILNLFRWLGTIQGTMDANGVEAPLAVMKNDNVFSGIPSEKLSSINLTFTVENGSCVVVNLGWLKSWIKGQKNYTDQITVPQVTNVQMQKVLLKFLISLQSFTRVEDEALAIQEPIGEVQDSTDAEEDEELIEAKHEYDEQHEIESEDTIDEHEYQGLTKNDKKPVKAAVSITDKVSTNELNLSSSIDSELEAIDEDLKVLEEVTSRNLKNRGLKVDKVDGVVDSDDVKEDLALHDIQKLVYSYESPTDALVRKLETQVDYALLSASDYRNFKRNIEAFKDSKDPYGSGVSFTEAMHISPEMLKLDNEKTLITGSDLVADKSMLQSSLLSFDQDYIEKIMPKDMLSMVYGLQKAGIVIRKHEIDIDHSALGSYESHRLELKPIDGQTSVVHFKVPVIDSDGTFTASGNKYTLRKQRVDKPIRKIKPTEVALTSYYGKTFVKINPKKSNNSVEWIIKELNIASMAEGGFIKRVNPAQVFDNAFVAPFMYNALADNFKSIETERFTLIFDHNERKDMVNEIALAKLEKNGSRVVGLTIRKEPIVIDKDNVFHIVNQNGELAALGDIYQTLRLDSSKAPVDFTEVNIFSKTVPVAFVLAYTIGFKNLVKLVQARYRIVEGRQQKNLESHEYAVQFKDQSFIFSRKDKVASMILAGFNEYDKQLKQYEAADFNHKDIYLNLLETKGLGAIYIREIDLMQQLFVDPITKAILEQMNEPTTLLGLLVRSTEMLQTYHHPDSQDMNEMRVRGYERVSGAVYKEMVTSIRSFTNRNIAGKSKIDISPYKVWSGLMLDPAKKMVEDINPIQNLKESEIVTYAGEGGRGKDSMNKDSRAYHPSDMGVISEATVDSSDVGVNAYLSANPKFHDLRGIASKDNNGITPSSLLSTSTLLAPGSDSDDFKRVNFVNIQQAHTIAADAYHPSVIRTGYEYVIANRTTDMFAFNAKQDGKVVSITEKGIVVEYDDKTQKGATLGRTFGRAEGSVYPHDIVTDLKEGQKFTKGTAIAYNKGFFEKDFLDPSKIVLKNSRLTKVALLESFQTHEDSCAISPKLAAAMNAKTTKVKSFVIDFKQNLINVVKVGQEVTPKTFLMIIEDEITSSTGAFDEASLDVLKRLSNQAPKSSYLGVVDRVEVFYNGDKADMSVGLKAITDKSDKFMLESSRESGKPAINGSVNSDYRVSGVPLTIDKAEVRFYITVEGKSGTGDKIVAANQMKSVIGEVMDYSVTTEDGTEIEMIFGNRSILARIVTSPFVMGTTATLLQVIQKKACEIYRS